MSSYIYTITLIKGLKTEDRENEWKFAYKELKPVGYFFTRAKAIENLENNYQNMSEDGFYELAVIEQYDEGLYTYDMSPQWYKWDKTDQKYYSIDDPVRHVSNWVFGSHR